MIITIKISDIIQIQIHTHVRRERYSEQTASGIILMAGGTFLFPLSSTKPKPVKHVR